MPLKKEVAHRLRLLAGRLDPVDYATIRVTLDGPAIHSALVVAAERRKKGLD